MIVGCPSCRRQFRVDDTRVRPGSKMRCARCGHTFASAESGGPPDADRPTPRATGSRPSAAAAVRPAGTPFAPVGGDAPLVLLADAGRPVRSLLRPILAELGCRVETADDGTAAFKAVVARHPIAIVASVHLGGLSGVAICEGVKGSPHLKDTKVALLGSDLSADLFNRDTAMAYGADVFLEEGMAEEALRASLRDMLPALPEPESDDAEAATGKDWEGSDFGLDALHQQAAPRGGRPEEEIARLARLMLSDLKLYNPDRFAQALRSGQVLEIFKAELSRGRDLVDQRFPQTTSRQEMLAAALKEGIAREGAH
ncbi:MAG TPA: zinc-ribbon domain-containing protein [Candidatus Polarisedimenticolia bacterium]|nr:zinc-ribbon domain-containing protein [Candidatus Polarisedimenticolia bacterium]